LLEVRIDKWLWAARFYKTRSLAKTAVEGGRVHIEGQRVKPGRGVRMGQTVEITRGVELFTVVVTGLAEKRGPAKLAQTLFEETEASIKKREEAAAQRKALASSDPTPENRPTKKQRRQIKILKDFLG
jgi:ribosome-associated heat shock protein Hsp15